MANDTVFVSINITIASQLWHLRAKLKPDEYFNLYTISMKLVCGDGTEASLPEDCLKRMSLFDDPVITTASSYTLKCKASSKTVHVLLDWLAGKSKEVIITEDNHDELQRLCQELGFSELDPRFRAFETRTVASNEVSWEDFLLLKECVMRHEKLLAELQRQLREFLAQNAETDSEALESLARKAESLERKVDEAERFCAKLSSKTLEKTEKKRNKCEKPPDLKETPNSHVTTSKEDKRKSISPVRDPDTVKDSDLPPLNSAPTAPRKVRNKAAKSHAKLPPLTPKHTDGHIHTGGIIAFLTNECGGNVNDKQIVYVQGSSVRDSSYHPKNAVDLGTFKDYWSCEEESPWICYDFKERRVRPTSYSLRSYDGEQGQKHLKSWVVEVSNDGYKWTEVDSQDQSEFSSSKCVNGNFNISHVLSESFRFVRLRQARQWFAKSLTISSLEIFGTLFTVDQPKQSQLEFAYHPEMEGLSQYPLCPPMLDGIIRHLTREYCGNIHEKGIVYVIGNRFSVNAPENLIDPGTDTRYESFDKKDSWICYDFKEHRVIPKSYSVRSSDRRYLRSWAIEVSNNGSLWLEVDRRVDNKDLNGKFAMQHFKIPHFPSESFRFIRLRQTGPNSKGNQCLCLSSLEVFGILCTPEKIDQPKPKEREVVLRGYLSLNPKFDGIIASLTRECGGNVHEKGVIYVTGSSYELDDPKSVVDLWTYTGYRSKDEDDAWICYDFKEQRVIPKSYSVMSRERDYPECWVIEVSNDGASWTEIDHQSRVWWRKKFKMRNYEISHVPSESFRFFRLRQTVSNSDDNHRLCLSSLEIFGTLCTPEKIDQPKPNQGEFVYYTEKEEQFPGPCFPLKLDGIIASLTRECGGNVHEKGIVYVIGSDPTDDPKRLVDFGSEPSFRPEYEMGLWICYDFKEPRVIPTSYAVRSCTKESFFTSKKGRLQSWVIEVSNDGYSWTEIDHRLNCQFLMERKKFKISRVPSESFRFFRLRQVGVDIGRVIINSLEIFGAFHTTHEPKPPKREFVYHSKLEGLFPPPVVPPKRNGIIEYLTRECLGNVHEKGIIHITASSYTKDDPKNLADLWTDSCYTSKNEQNSWICYDFKERRVTPTSYSVRSSDGLYLTRWVIEASDDGDSWTKLDHQNNNNLTSKFAIENFKIFGSSCKSFRFFRLRQTFWNSKYNDCLKICALEIFGTLYEK